MGFGEETRKFARFYEIMCCLGELSCVETRYNRSLTQLAYRASPLNVADFQMRPQKPRSRVISRETRLRSLLAQRPFAPRKGLHFAVLHLNEIFSNGV